MRPSTSYSIAVAIVLAITAVAFGVYRGLAVDESRVSTSPSIPIVGSSVPSPTNTTTPTATPLPSPTSTPIPEITTLIDHPIPFTSQAPFGQWNIEAFQDGCEEASSLMAMHWVNQTPITSEEAARQAILDITQFEEKNYNGEPDRSAADTVQLIKDYFKYDGVNRKTDISLADIKDQLALGNILIIPMNGRALNTQHYTPPGPERHMLLVRGYDPATKEFITNDPGTKFGEAFRFDENDLYGAIRDYPSGFHTPITGTQKDMIVIHPR